MKDYFNLRKSKLLLLTLLAILAGGVSPAWAQKALPYSYGFEESSSSDWTKTSCHSSTNNNNLGSSSAHGGSYVFRFYFNTNPPQYLITPELATSEKTINVSFWYKAYSTSYEESFKVGYSSTNNETSSFTWEDEVKTKSTTWTEYSTTFPAGTKYICIAYTANDKYYLYIDDFNVEETPTCLKPTGLTAEETTFSSVVLSWTKGSEEQDAWQISYSTSADFDPSTEGTIVDATTNPFTLTGLSSETTYYAYVRGNCGAEDKSDWSNKVSFTTPEKYSKPSGLACSSAAATSATLTWTAGGTETTWEIAYSTTNNFDPADATIVSTNTNPATLTGLTAATTYYVKVRAKIDDEYSGWSAQASFATGFAAPYTQAFGSSSIPSGWGQYSGLLANVLNGTTLTTYSGYSGWSFGTSNGVFDSHARINVYGTSCYTWLVTPNIELGTNDQLTFKLALTAYSGTLAAAATTGTDDKFAVLVSTDNGTTWTQLALWDNAGSERVYNNIATAGEEIALSLATYNNQAVKIAFYVESTVSNADNNLHIDDVNIDVTPSCIKPTGLTVNSVAARSAIIAWTSDADAWNVQYKTTADAEWTLVENITENPYTLSSLTPETEYQVQVQTNCGGGDVSAWTDAANFTTPASCITPTAFAANTVTTSSATLTWTDETEQTKWEVSYSTTSGAPADGTIVAVTEKTYTITGLTAGTTYYASVRAVNSDEDKSQWSSEISFTPGMLTVNEGTTTNGYIPIYGNYANYLTKSQVIIPAETLSSIANNRINKLVFYNNQNSRDWGSAKFDVYLTEVENTSFSNTTLESWDNMEKVYSGSLTVSDKQMVIELTDPYDYQGGNLMIGVNQTTAGSSAGIGWYGVSGVYNGVGGYGSSLSRQDFLPKMSVYYSAIPVAPRMVVNTTSIDFGLVEANSTQTATFTIENRKGTATLEGINVTCTDGAFSVSEVKDASIAVNGDAITVTVTFDTTTPGSYSGTITVSANDQEDATVNVCGTVKDPEKVYESGFASLPTDWTTDGTWYYSETNGAYTTAWYIDSGTLARLKTPKLTISEGEKFIVEAKGYSTSNTSYQHLQMQYSADGTTWTNFDNEPSLDPSNWKAFTFTFPEGVSGDYYIGILASQADIRMFYGGELPNEPKMVVTEPASLDYGIINEATTKTFTIANTGKAELKGINVTSSNAAFTITGAPTALAAGASAEVTISMSAATAGVLSSDITVSATDMENVVFTVSGVVLPEGMSVEDFSGTTIPANWTSSGSWTFTTDGIASGKSSSAYLMTPKLTFSEGDFLVIRMAPNDTYSGDYLAIEGSSNNGSSYGAYYKKIEVPQGKDVYANYVVSDIPTTINRIRFVGYYVDVDEIHGLTYAPELKVTDKNETVVASGLTYDFGECGTNADVTYNFANIGTGTINITNVAVTGDGAAAYSTNWTESVAAPFALTITRAYDGGRTEAQAAVVTVTTSEGEFVINVTGTDKAANAPELAVSLGGEAVATGAAADFGTKLQAAPAAKTYTITNAGTGTLTGTIATSDNTLFTVSKTEFSLGAAESTTFDLALVYDENYGAKAATITIHPTNEGLEDVVINATASTLDPDAWIEDFAAGTLPTGWTQGTWTIGTFSSYENKTTMALAPSSSTAGTIITPCLTAKKDEVLTWDAYFKWADEALIVEYSNDEQQTWNAVMTVYGTESGEKGSSSQVNYHKELSFTAPANGEYYLRFTSTYSNGVDNFAGFKLNLPDHIMAITASNIPTSSSYSPTMKQGVSFTATVTVKESRGVDEENVVAKLYMGDEVIGTSEATTVEANATKQITIVATPTVAAEDAEMHIEVTYAGGTLKTDEVTRTVEAPVELVLDETSTEAVVAGTYDIVTVNRTFAAGWNTIVLPFRVSDLSVFGEGAKIYEFSSYADGALAFNTVTSMNAVPYLIYMPEDRTEALKFTNVTIYSGDTDDTYSRVIHGDVLFQGTYAPVQMGDISGKCYGVTAAGKIMKAGAQATMKGFRAYFNIDAANAQLGGGDTRLYIVLDDETTGITRVIAADEVLEGVYNLKGQKVEQMKRGGVYIKNGKKVVR